MSNDHRSREPGWSAAGIGVATPRPSSVGRKIAPSRAPSLPRYAAGISCGAAAAGLAFLAFLVTLDSRGDLPAPAVANNICVDEKLKFLREKSPPNPSLLVFGSSVAWRNIDGAPIHERSRGQIVPLNLGLCGSQISQTDVAAHYFLDRYRSASSVLLVVGLTDLEDCGRPPHFRASDADQYLNGGVPKYAFYFKNFDFMSLIRNAPTIASRRQDPSTAEAMVISRFGDGPSLMRRDLFYEGGISVDDRCLGALRSFARELPQQVRNVAVVVSPVHPEWVAEYDHSSEHLARFVAQLRGAIAGTKAVLWNAHAELGLDSSYFGDAVHLRSPGARRFSEYLAERVAKEFSGS